MTQVGEIIDNGENFQKKDTDRKSWQSFFREINDVNFIILKSFICDG